jgi:hypothetical protein
MLKPERQHSQRRRVRCTSSQRLSRLAEAVSQQARRLCGSSSVTHVEHQADAVLFVHALRDLLRLVTLAHELASGEACAAIGDALDRMAAAVPAAKDARDALAHLDEYIVGFGMKRLDVPPLPWFSRAGEDYTVLVGTFAINVATAERFAVDAATAVIVG